jgi:hypothetical protein
LEHRLEDKRLAPVLAAGADVASQVVLLGRLWRGSRMHHAASATRGASQPVYRHSFADVLTMHRSDDPETVRQAAHAAACASRLGFLVGGSAQAVAAVVSATAGGSKAVAPDSSTLDEATASAVLTSFDSNTFLVVDDLFHGRAAGVFPAGALLNHSCAPNAILMYAPEEDFKSQHVPIATEAAPHSVFRDEPLETPRNPATRASVVQVVRALRPIAAGEEVCHSFVEVALPRRQRQAQLRRAYGFDCACELCTAEAAAEAGVTPSGGGAGSPVDALPSRDLELRLFAHRRRRLESSSDASLLVPSPTLAPLPGPSDLLAPAEGVRLASPLQRLQVEVAHALALTGEYASDRAAQVQQLTGMLRLLAERNTAACDGASPAGPTAATAPALVDPSMPLLSRVSAALGLSEAATLKAVSEAAMKEAAGGPYWRHPQLAEACSSPSAEQAAAIAEVAAIETALAGLRTGGVCHSQHLAVQAAVNALLPRYLVLNDLPAAVAACLYVIDFYGLVFGHIGAHPLLGLQLYTAADLAMELHGALGTAAAAVAATRKRVGGASGGAGFSTRSAPTAATAGGAVSGHSLVTTERWSRLQVLMGPRGAATVEPGKSTFRSDSLESFLALPVASTDLTDAGAVRSLRSALKERARDSYVAAAENLRITHGALHNLPCSAATQGAALFEKPRKYWVQ